MGDRVLAVQTTFGNLPKHDGRRLEHRETVSELRNPSRNLEVSYWPGRLGVSHCFHTVVTKVCVYCSVRYFDNDHTIRCCCSVLVHRSNLLEKEHFEQRCTEFVRLLVNTDGCLNSEVRVNFDLPF